MGSKLIYSKICQVIGDHTKCSYSCRYEETKDRITATLTIGNCIVSWVWESFVHCKRHSRWQKLLSRTRPSWQLMKVTRLSLEDLLLILLAPVSSMLTSSTCQSVSATVSPEHSSHTQSCDNHRDAICHEVWVQKLCFILLCPIWGELHRAYHITAAHQGSTPSAPLVLH